ncbi:MAG TPA: phage tail sheath subtilisin-like domain-containing protein [Bryobacteraceae bacterium]|nr:phage tail sheath subtilisin-like domain-containing protein [Bryobacteraceae bacterium]
MPELLHPGVYVQEVPSAVKPIAGVSTSTAAFVGVADKGPIPGTTLANGRMAEPIMVTSFTDYQRQFGGFRTDSFLTYAVQSFFQNGGSRAYIVRVAATGPGSPPVAPCSPPMPPSSTIATHAVTSSSFSIAISALYEGAWGNDISVVISPSSDSDSNNFKLTVLYDAGSGATPVETYDRVTFLSQSLLPNPPNPAEYVRTAVNTRSEYIAITADVTSRPANSQIVVSSPPTIPPRYIPTPLTCGADGAVPAPDGFIGAPAPDNTVTGTGLYALDKITDVNIIAIPGQGDPGTVNAGVDYCKDYRQLQDCFFIGDMGSFANVDFARVDGAAPSVRTREDAIAFASTGFGGTPLDKAAGDYGAIYYPWVWSADPIGSGRNPKILLPPSGFMAGIYARTDNSRGVFKAPAGTEAGVAGAIALATTVSDAEQDTLNPISVNVIRTVPGSGFVVWGTRTFGSDASWRYVPVRRMAIFLRTSIYYGIQWAVFEPNDEPLWAELRLNIRAFMLTQFRAGAFQGSKPDDAFFVACDSSTTTQQDIDNGVVNILVGFAPLKPAEFVVLKLSQKVNQGGS